MTLKVPYKNSSHMNSQCCITFCSHCSPLCSHPSSASLPHLKPMSILIKESHPGFFPVLYHLYNCSYSGPLHMLFPGQIALPTCFTWQTPIHPSDLSYLIGKFLGSPKHDKCSCFSISLHTILFLSCTYLNCN